MSFDLSISELVKLVYEVPVSFLIFYYLILYIVLSIVRKVAEIHIEGLNEHLGFFKIDQRMIPALLVIGFFGLIFRFVSYLDLFQTAEASLMSVLIFIVIIFMLTLTRDKIREFLIRKRYAETNPTARIEPDRRESYINNSHHYYQEVIMSIGLIVFLLIFSILQFSPEATILLISLILTYGFFVVRLQVRRIQRDLTRWF